MYPEYREGQIKHWQWFASKNWRFDDEFLNSCNQRSGRIKLVNLLEPKCVCVCVCRIHIINMIRDRDLV